MERYYIYSGRRWLELDIVRGRLAGRSGPVSFLCAHGGTLQEVPREDVLHQLRARAAGRKSRVTCAAPLPSKRRRKHRTKCACKYKASSTNPLDKDNHNDNPENLHTSRRSPPTFRGNPPTFRGNPPTFRSNPPHAAPRTKTRAISPDDLSQNEFAARLGLAPSPSRSTPVQPPRRRDYEAGEDRALLHWLAEDEKRARAVRGVAVWRQLENGVGLMTGTRRSWHSLKNRYLRYLLPSLHSLPLSDSQRARLKAGAAPRPNPHASILLPRSPKVISASARALRPKASRPEDSRPEAPRRPPVTSSPPKPPSRPRVTRSSLPRARPVTPPPPPQRSRSPKSPRLRRRQLYNVRKNI